MSNLQFDKLRSNKALALNTSAPDAEGHFAELFTVILQHDNSLTFEFSKSVLIEPKAGNAINVQFKA